MQAKPLGRAETWFINGVRVVLALLLLLGWIVFTMQAVFAQTPTVVALTGHAVDVTGQPPTNVSVSFQLAGCGGNQPHVYGHNFSLIPQVYNFIPDPTTGLLSGNIWPNDVIDCGGTTGATNYWATFISNNVPSGPRICYVILSSNNPFDLDTATPCTDNPGPPAPNPGLCPAGQYVTGFGPPLGIICGLPPSSPIALPQGCTTGQVIAGFDSSGNIVCIPFPTPGPTLEIQHNGTDVALQTLLNFDDTIPAPPSGSESVTFQTDSSGKLSGYVPIPPGTGLELKVTPPVGGQYVIIPPTSITFSGSGSVNASKTGYIGSPYCIGGGTGIIHASGFTLPSYVLPGNVTAVYAFSVSANYPLPGIGTCFFSTPQNPTNFVFAPFQATATGAAPVGLQPPVNPDNSWPLQQFTSSLFGVTGANIPTTDINATGSVSTPFALGSEFDLPLVGLIVYYTGSAPPCPGGPSCPIDVVPPLSYSPLTNLLAVSPTASFPGKYLLPWTVAQAKPLAGSSLPGSLFLILDGTGPLDCTTGGGSTKVLCTWSGTALVPFTPGLTPFSVRTNVTGSRVFGTIYHNTGTTTLYASGYGTISGGSGDSTISCLAGPTSGLGDTPWSTVTTATIGGEHVGFDCMVPGGNFYELTVTNLISGTPGKWYETQ